VGHPAPGWENVTAEHAKLSGMFPLPGAPRQQTVDPNTAPGFHDATRGTSQSAQALKPSQARQSKRLFVYNLPPSATEESIVEFFNLQLNGLNVISGTDPLPVAMVAKHGEYAMLEFRHAEDATMAIGIGWD